MDTVWHLEHLLKDTDDLKAYLELPEPVFGGEPDTDVILDAEKKVRDGGITLIDIGDPFLSMVRPQPYTAVLRTFDAGLPAGKRYESRAHDLYAITDGVTDTMM